MALLQDKFGRRITIFSSSEFRGDSGLMMFGRLSRHVAAVSCLALFCIVGCGGTYDASVSGIVTLDGAPVPRGMVSYQPVSGGPAAYAPIQENGEYVVRTGRENGLPSGEYDVTVTAN
jgi:hypothetical protein